MEQSLTLRSTSNLIFAEDTGQKGQNQDPTMRSLSVLKIPVSALASPTTCRNVSMQETGGNINKYRATAKQNYNGDVKEQ